MQTRKNTVIWILTFAAIVVAILIIAGVIKTPLSPHGKITIEGLDANEKVFVDNVPQSISFNKRDNATISAAAGIRDVLVSRDGYWPYLKQISVEAGKTASIHPFLFPKQPDFEGIDSRDPEYYALIALIKKQTIPSEPHLLGSSEGTVTIWKEGSALKAKWIGSGPIASFLCPEGDAGTCQSGITFFNANEPVQAVAFWRDRPDVAIVASGEKIFALELDLRPIQNFQLLYQGVRPVFALTPTGTLIVLDDGHLYSLALAE